MQDIISMRDIHAGSGVYTGHLAAHRKWCTLRMWLNVYALSFGRTYDPHMGRTRQDVCMCVCTRACMRVRMYVWWDPW